MLLTRLIVALVGAACVGRSLRALRHPTRSGEPRRSSRPPAGRSVLRKLVRWLAVRASTVGWLRQQHRDTEVARSRTLAPGAWPWRLARASQPTDPRQGFTDAHVLAGVRLLTGIAGLLIGLVLVATTGPDLVVALIVLPPAGVITPDLALSRASRRASRALLAELPHIVDLLAAGLAAGRGLEEAIAASAHQAAAPLGRLLEEVAIRIAVGVAATAGLQSVAQRTGNDALKGLAELLVRQQQLGIPAAPALRLMADDLRARAHTQAQARAGRAGPLCALITGGVIAPACVVALIVAVIDGLTVRGSGFLGL